MWGCGPVRILHIETEPIREDGFPTDQDRAANHPTDLRRRRTGSDRRLAGGRWGLGRTRRRRRCAQLPRTLAALPDAGGFGLISVVMIFISFTTAYVVRKAGVIWDPARNEYVSNWVPATLPVKLLLLNTLILLLSSFTLEVARRRAEQDVALAPIANIPGIRISPNRSLPWLWMTIGLGLAVPVRAISGVGAAAPRTLRHRDQHRHLVLLHSDRSTCGRISSVAFLRCCMRG